MRKNYWTSIIFEIISAVFLTSVFLTLVFGDGSINSELEYVINDCPLSNQGNCMDNFWWFLAWKFGVSIGIMVCGMLAVWILTKLGLRVFFRGILPALRKCIHILNNSPKENQKNSL